LRHAAGIARRTGTTVSATVRRRARALLTDRVGIGDPPTTNFQHRVFYAGRHIRDLLATGRVDYVPVSLSDVPVMFRRSSCHLT
jgi:hypothetical protein